MTETRFDVGITWWDIIAALLSAKYCCCWEEMELVVGGGGTALTKYIIGEKHTACKKKSGE
jgi:hypothetical protein